MNTVKEKNRQVAVLFWCIYLFVSHPELNSKRQKRRPLRQISARLQAVPCVICLQWFVSKRLFSYPVVELGREVEFAIAEMACVSRNVRRTFHVPFLLFQILRTVKDFPTFHFWARCLTSGVELGLTGLTSTSWYVRTTRSESLAAYQSSVSVLSVRPRILVRKVFYFYSQILIGCLGILGLLRRRMVVVSHLFRHRRC